VYEEECKKQFFGGPGVNACKIQSHPTPSCFAVAAAAASPASNVNRSSGNSK
jgi:hypothetical protein